MTKCGPSGPPTIPIGFTNNDNNKQQTERDISYLRRCLSQSQRPISSFNYSKSTPLLSSSKPLAAIQMSQESGVVAPYSLALP
jgi:hypothetical protein